MMSGTTSSGRHLVLVGEFIGGTASVPMRKLFSYHINMAYLKTLAIRDYFVLLLGSAITKCNQKTMAIVRIVTCIFDDGAGSRRSWQDHEDRSRVF